MSERKEEGWNKPEMTKRWEPSVPSTIFTAALKAFSESGEPSIATITFIFFFLFVLVCLLLSSSFFVLFLLACLLLCLFPLFSFCVSLSSSLFSFCCSPCEFPVKFHQQVRQFHVMSQDRATKTLGLWRCTTTSKETEERREAKKGRK